MVTPERQVSSLALISSLFVIGASMLAVFLWLAFHRNIDGDEGLYLEAARLIAEGKRPYFDFFYQQMPLIPYVYAAWIKLFGPDLITARVLTATLTAFSGLIILAYVARTTKNLITLNICGFLFFANGLVLAWAPVIKTHPFSMLALSCALVSLFVWREKGESLGWLAIAGLAIGFGINCRLTLGPLAPLFLAFVILHARPGKRLLSMAAFTLAVLLTSLPTFYFFFSDPDLFLRFNLKYHLEVYPGIATDKFRWAIFRAVFAEWQMMFLSLLLFAGVLMRICQGWRELLGSNEALLFCCALSFAAIHLATATPFTQYFSALVPILLLGAAPVLTFAFERRARATLMALVPCVLFYAVSAKSVMNYEINSMGSDYRLWELARVERAVQEIKKIVKPGEYCITWWPGYAFLSGCASPPGMENHMRSHAIAVRIPMETLESYKMMSDERLLEHLKSRQSRVVIAGVYRLWSPYYAQINHALKDQYSLIKEAEGVRIYVAKDLTDDILDSYIRNRESAAFLDAPPAP